MIGFFINTLALRSKLSAEMTFSKLLGEVKQTTLEAYSHQEVPFEKIVDAVVKTRDMSRSPLFQVLFSLQNTPDVPKLELGELQLFTAAQEHTRAKFDIAFLLNENSSGIHGTVEYSTALYEEATIARMTEHYSNLLRSVVAAVDQQVGSLNMLSATEQKELEQFNETTTEYPKDKSITALFEQQAAKTPKSIAVVFENKELSYKELNERSNQLANYLIKQGVKAETLVPVCVERSAEMLIGILGILKAGGAYVPIDPEYPQDRITYMLEDTGAEIILSNTAGRALLPPTEALIIALDSDWELIAKEPSTATRATHPEPGNLAYVMYTSGSTGRPKGVQIEHRGVVSLVKNAGYVSADSTNTLLVTGSPSFDATTFEYWSMLLNGGKLILCGLEALLNSETLKATIRQHKVNMMWFTSSWFNQLADSNPEVFSGLRTLLAGGEKLSEPHIEKIRSLYPEITLINGYGPTENTTFSLTYAISEVKDPIPVGRPLNNRKAYIISQSGSLSPVGVTGEICLGGAGLARGYLNQPELTAEKFIKDPFSDEQDARLYRTGDLGRWLADGNIEYQGRIDDQVKIRGYRIELGEIESVLNQNETISQGVVLAKEDKQGTKRLVGYVVSSQTAFDKQAIQAWLNTKLPEYMVPAIWVELDSLPLTSNGKVDKKALPDPELTDLSAEYVAPRNETEQALADIWQELLHIEQIGINNNFFELGGHSLLAMRVVSAVRKELDVELTIKNLFVHPTIAGLGTFLDEQHKGTLLPAIIKTERPALYPAVIQPGTAVVHRSAGRERTIPYSCSIALKRGIKPGSLTKHAP